jgi:hypothetical protein
MLTAALGNRVLSEDERVGTVVGTDPEAPDVVLVVWDDGEESRSALSSLSGAFCGLSAFGVGQRVELREDARLWVGSAHSGRVAGPSESEENAWMVRLDGEASSRVFPSELLRVA